MKVLLLNGEKNEKNDLNQFVGVMERKLEQRDWLVNEIKLHKKTIADCLGCFACWVKKPGLCIIDDDAQEIARRFINSDLIIYLTPVFFGGYSYQLKKALDRMIPLMSPFFTKVDGEIHHKPRYGKYPSIIGIGVMTEFNKEEAELFKNLVRRNSINLHSPNCASDIFIKDKETDCIEQKIYNLLNKVSDKK